MSLTARTREAREHADRTGDPGDEALAAALEVRWLPTPANC